jgi:hypothetical protein
VKKVLVVCIDSIAESDTKIPEEITLFLRRAQLAILNPGKAVDTPNMTYF